MDFASTPTAELARSEKARTLSGWLWHRSLDAEHVQAWDEVTRRRAARDAEVNPPRAGSPTWALACDMLDGWTGVRRGADLHAGWCQLGCVVPTKPAQVLEREPDAPTSIGPRGWDLIAAQPLVPGWRCTVRVNSTTVCGAPAVTRSPSRRGGDDVRCPLHPPVGTDWGAHLDWTPRNPRR